MNDETTGKFSSDGYNVEIEYTHDFHAEIGPTWLSFIAQLGGHAPAASEDFTYYDLGCGQGDTTAVLAACHPRARFHGIDFMERHIAHATDLARAAGLDNVSFLVRAFADLAGMDLPPADYIVLHGVYSWVNAENRRHILDFIERRLKPGGLAYVSYNALPGNAGVAALRRLLTERAAAAHGSMDERIAQSMALAYRLDKARALFFEAHAFARKRLSTLEGQDPRYLAHEYFNAEWTPFFHADVARELARAGLVHVAQAKPIDDLDMLVLRPAWRQVLRDDPVLPKDRALRETIKDYARNRAFRADIFARPHATAPAPMAPSRLALFKPRATCELKATTTAGEIELPPALHAPILDALARTPMTLAELAGAPELAGLPRDALRPAVLALLAIETIGPALTAAQADQPDRIAATRRFNQALAFSRPIAGGVPALASPVLGSGVVLRPAEMALAGSPIEPAAAVKHALARLPVKTTRLRIDGKVVSGEAGLRAALTHLVPDFNARTRPFLRQLAITA